MHYQFRFTKIIFTNFLFCKICSPRKKVSYDMYTHCLHWPMLTHLLFQLTFCQLCKFMTGKIMPMEGSTAVDIAVTVSIILQLYIQLFGLCSRSQPIVGTCGRHNPLCHLASILCIAVTIHPTFTNSTNPYSYVCADSCVTQKSSKSL